MKKYIMAIDQGTTGSTVLLMDQGGSLVASAEQDFKQIYPEAGWVEHDPNDIWTSVQNSAKKVLQSVQATPQDILTIGITNQRETVLAWRKSNSEILHNAIVWQCRRTTALCQKLKVQHEKLIKAKTGLVLDPYFSASKINWMLTHVPAVKKALKEKDLAFGTIDTFLMWKLSQGHIFATDVSNASRTMLMNLKTLSWDKELLKIFKVPAETLPEIKASATEFGFTKGLGFVSDNTLISGVAGDQQAALFGQTCFAKGESKCTFGTGSFILMNTGSQILKSKAKLLTTVAWKIKNQPVQYALEGGAFVCGAAVQWLRDGLKIINSSSEVEKLAEEVDSTLGVEFVPALTGLGAPHWRPEARGVITGLTRGSTIQHIARATLEAMALQNADILQAMQKDLGQKMKKLRVDGGASANNLLMQMQANFIEAQVDRPQQIDTTAMGAAYLAGLGAGLWKNTDEIKKIWKIEKSFKPILKKAALKKRKAQWELALKKSY